MEISAPKAAAAAVRAAAFQKLTLLCISSVKPTGAIKSRRSQRKIEAARASSIKHRQAEDLLGVMSSACARLLTCSAKTLGKLRLM